MEIITSGAGRRVKKFSEEWNRDALRERHHLDRRHELLRHLHRARPARHAAVADESDWLVRPFV